MCLYGSSVYTYVVEVYTGELDNAGTEANVYMMLVGRRGDTGRRKLLKSLGFADKKFQPAQVWCTRINCATWMGHAPVYVWPVYFSMIVVPRFLCKTRQVELHVYTHWKCNSVDAQSSKYYLHYYDD